MAGLSFLRSVVLWHAEYAVNVQRAFVWLLTDARLKINDFEDTAFGAVVLNQGHMFLEHVNTCVSFAPKVTTLDQVRECVYNAPRMGCAVMMSAMLEGGTMFSMGTPVNWVLADPKFQVLVLNCYKAYVRQNEGVPASIRRSAEEECGLSVETRAGKLVGFDLEVELVPLRPPVRR